MSATERMMTLILVAVALWPVACASTAPGDEGAGQEKREEVRIVLKGNTHISDRDLKRAAVDELALLNRLPEEYRADDAAFTMEEYYREQGYPFVRVGYDFQKEPRLKVTFRVTEGPRTVLGDVALEGRGDVSRRTLMRFFEGPTDAWMDIGGNALFIQSRVDQAAKLIRSWYRSEGYLKVEVDSPVVTFRDKNTVADIRVQIRAGLKYTVQNLFFKGVNKEMQDRLLEGIDYEQGMPFTHSWQRRAEGACRTVLRNFGHVDLKISSRVVADDATGCVDLNFTIETGPVYKVGDVTFKGLVRTDESVLEPHLKLTTGEVFNGRKLRDTMTSLSEMGIFSKLRVAETPRDDGRVDICFLVGERDSKDLAFMAGYGSYEMVRGSIAYTDRNVLGRGLSWTSQLKASMKGARINSGLSDSSFLNLPVTGSAEAFTQYRAFPSFTDKRVGTILSLSKHWNRLKGTVGYSFEKSMTSNVDEGAMSFEATERVNLGTLFTRWVMDDRNHILSPDRGSKHEIGLEFSEKALGGEISFNKFTGSTSWLFPLDESARWVFATRGEAGLLLRSGDTSFIPIQFRFFNGGADSVRSFREGELSPRRYGDFVGGEYYSTASVELRTPLLKHLRGVLFADAGNVIERRQDIRLRYYRYALGVGLRYALPIGPIRLDWGWNPNRQSHEDLWALHFSIGFPF